MNANGREMNITARVWFRSASALIRSKSGVFRNPKRFMVRFSGQFCSEFGLFQNSFDGQNVKTTVLLGNYGCFFFPSLSLKAFILCEGGRLRLSRAPKEALAPPTDRPSLRFERRA